MSLQANWAEKYAASTVHPIFAQTRQEGIEFELKDSLELTVLIYILCVLCGTYMNIVKGGKMFLFLQ